MKPAKILMEHEQEYEFPTSDQYKGQFVSDIEAWESVVSGFPENVREELNVLILRLEEEENIDTALLRQTAVIFRGNSKDDPGLRIAKWLDTMADFADFFGEGVDIIIDSAMKGGGEDEEEFEESDEE